MRSTSLMKFICCLINGRRSMAKTKYTEIPNEETPVLSTACKVRDVYVNGRTPTEMTNGVSSEIPLLKTSTKEKNGANICTHCHRHRRKSSETISRSCSAGTLKNRQRKSHSLPSSCSLNSIDGDDSVILQIPPEDFATQLTLLDMPVFAKITPDELMSCSWNKHNKLEVTPNIVAFTRRFNQISFWAVQEVLKGSSPKSRADILSHYVRISKKLYELSNFHSLFAIVSALRSAPVYRLSKSWYHVSKKDKQTFEKLSNVFSEEENWKNLREHLESLKLPCIPYLGMFLTDIVYVNMAHPHTGGLESEQRRFKMNNTLRVISHLQQSQYDLQPMENIQLYLNSINYIEELQKFVEDDQYKLSLRLEPMSHAYGGGGASAGGGGSKKSSSFITDSCSAVTETVAKLNLSPAKLPSKLPNASAFKYIRGHRKCLSLEPSVLKTLPSIQCETQSRHLLDDSVIEDNGLNNLYPKISVNNKSISFREEPEQVVIMEGCLKKKIVVKHGCHPTVSSWHRYWVQLSSTSLLFFQPKCFKGMTRKDFKKHPYKVWPVEGCIVTLGENPEVFLFHNTQRSKLYKFRATNDSTALKWYRSIYNVAQGKREEVNPSNLISFE